MEGDAPEQASGKPVSKEDVRSKLEKLGNTAFFWEDIKIEMDDGLFVPMSMINRMRREACDLLFNTIADAYRRPPAKPYLRASAAAADKSAETSADITLKAEGRMPEVKRKEDLPPALSASCEDRKTASLLLREKSLKRLYVPLRFAEEVLAERRTLSAGDTEVNPAEADGKSARNLPEIFISLPMMTRNLFIDPGADPFRRYLELGASGFLVRDTEMLGALTGRGLSEYIITDASLYAWNDEAVHFLDELGTAGNTAPYELNEGELRHRDNSRSEMVIYGYLPVMVSQQCVRMNCTKEGCTGRYDKVFLKDRTGKKFTVQCDCAPFPPAFLKAAGADKERNTKKRSMCCNIIYNSLPFGLPDEREQVYASGFRSLRLAFTIETPEEALSVYREYAGRYLPEEEKETDERSGCPGMDRKDGKPSAGNNRLTKGHFKRGVM